MLQMRSTNLNPEGLNHIRQPNFLLLLHDPYKVEDTNNLLTTVLSGQSAF
jgi:hypothetical protein